MNLLELYTLLKNTSSVHAKNHKIDALNHDEAISLLKRVFLSVAAEPNSFRADQKFLALSLDYNKNLLFADVSTGFDESVAICVDSTTLYKPELTKFLVLLFKLPDDMFALTDHEVKILIANTRSTGISPEDLYSNSERFELVHVEDVSIK